MVKKKNSILYITNELTITYFVIHSFLFVPASPQLGLGGLLEPIPAVKGPEAGYAVDRSHIIMIIMTIIIIPQSKVPKHLRH